MGKDIKSMSLQEAQSYKGELKRQGKSESTSKEYAKLSDYIKTLKVQSGATGYGKKEIASAYTNLSRGVTETGGWTEANLDNIEAATGTRPQLTAPTGDAAITREHQGSSDLSSYLNNYQEGIFNSKDSVALRDSITKQIEPEMAKPEPLNRVEQYEKLRQDMGVADLETNLNDLKTQLESEVATTRQRRNTVEGQQVSMNVISGRVSEVERQQNERIDAINRQIATATDQLNTSYNVISNYMNLMGLDYQDAVNAYNTEFSRNLQIYQLVDSEMDEQVANARSNLQVYTNAITQGNMDYGSLSSDQKAMINKLEVQSGLPIGFVSKLQMAPKDRILKISEDGSQAITYDSGGNMKLVNTGFSMNGGSGSGNSKFNAAIQDGIAALKSGENWGTVWGRVKSQFPSASDESIDKGLGTDWREAGAYENFKKKTASAITTAGEQTDIQESKQLIIQNGGTSADLKRAETDPDFRAYIKAKYGYIQ